MNYEIIETTNLDETTTKHVVIANDDESFISFPAVEGNPCFDTFIAENPDALTPKKAGK
jgi:hypothetical protein